MMQFNFGFPTENYWWLPAPATNPTQPPLATVAGKLKRRPRCSRRIKPPYSYTELITQAIRSSPKRTVTLREIVAYLQAQYHCFRGEYQGWRNSVRHNLSASECFKKILRDHNKPNGKDNFWTLNENCSHCLNPRDSKGAKTKKKTVVKVKTEKADDTSRPQTTPAGYQEDGAEKLLLAYRYQDCQDSPRNLVIDIGDESASVDFNNNGPGPDLTDDTRIDNRVYDYDMNNNSVLSNNKSATISSNVRVTIDDGNGEVVAQRDNNGSSLATTVSESALADDNRAIHPVGISSDVTGWSRMTVGNVDDLIYLSSNAGTAPHHPQPPQWSNFLPNYGRPYGDHRQFIYPYRPVAPSQSYLAPDPMYQNRFCFPPYNMANPGFTNFAMTDQQEDLSRYPVSPPQPRQPMSPSEGYSDGMSCGQTPSPASDGPWAPHGLSVDDSVYQQI